MILAQKSVNKVQPPPYEGLTRNSAVSAGPDERNTSLSEEVAKCSG